MSYNQEGRIRDVFEDNLEDELRKISDLLDEYNFISMDTEFPGIVFPLSQNSQYTSRHIESFLSNSNFSSKGEGKSSFTDANYRNIKLNVDNLKMIQIGITLANEAGEFPEGVSTWQFNFKFSLDRDPHLHESINLLELAGIDFKKFQERGIDMDHFGEVFTTSGLVLNESIKWITFHGSYDFAYLIKALSNQVLPEDENIFNEMLAIYFCNFYDVRQMIKNVTWLKGSLSRISTDLDIKRIGNTHQAGSDSLVTSKVFFKLLANFNDHIDVFSDKNKLFGFSYKNAEDYDWNMGGFVNNFSNYSVPPFMIGGMSNINSINNINSMSNLNNLTTIQTKGVPLGSMSKPVSVPVSNTPIYYQNGYNYQNNGVSGNINGMNSHSIAPNMLPYYGNGTLNSMNNMNNINAPMNGFNPLYQQQMDYAYYGNYYPGGNSSNGTGSGSGSFKNGQNGIQGQGKDIKFIQN